VDHDLDFDPDDSEDVVIDRWATVVEQDVRGIRSWVSTEVLARVGGRIAVTVRAISKVAEVPANRVVIDGRRGGPTFETLHRVLAGALEDLPFPFAGVLVLAVGSPADDDAALMTVPLMVGPQDRLRRAPGVRELARRVSYLAARNREMDRANLSLVKSAPLLLMSAAEVIKATRGVNLAKPWVPADTSSPTAKLVSDFVRDVIMPRWSPRRTTQSPAEDSDSGAEADVEGAPEPPSGDVVPEWPEEQAGESPSNTVPGADLWDDDSAE
jgi:hypothetical protein